MSWIDANTILLATVGSALYGTNVDGSDDHDEMGICIEGPEYLIGLQLFEQDVVRSAETRYQQESFGVNQPSRPGAYSPKSQPGDTDRVVYSLQKFCRLALGGNPNLISLFFVPDDKIITATPAGLRLQALAPAFVSMQAGRAFRGYLTAQKQRLLGERGQRDVNRPELVSKYGYDTKYAYHALRLGMQGLELMKTGALTQPLAPADRAYCCDVRRGAFSFQDVMTHIGHLERELLDLLAGNPWPEHGNTAAVDEFLVSEYRAHWETHQWAYWQTYPWPTEQAA